MTNEGKIRNDRKEIESARARRRAEPTIKESTTALSRAVAGGAGSPGLKATLARAFEIVFRRGNLVDVGDMLYTHLENNPESYADLEGYEEIMGALREAVR